MKHTLEQLIQRRLIVSVATTDFRKKVAERKAKVSQIIAAGKQQQQQQQMGSASSAAGGGASTTAQARTVISKQKRKLHEVSNSAMESQSLSGPDSYLPMELRMGPTASATAESEFKDAEGGNNTTKAATDAVRAESRPTRGRGRGRGVPRATKAGRGSAPAGSSDAGVSQEPQAMDVSSASSSSSSTATTPFAFGGAGSLDGPREDVLWTIGWDQYVRESRHAMCVTYVAERMEALAGRIVQLMLQASLSSEMSVAEPFSKRLGVQQIHELVRQQSRGSSHFSASPFVVLYGPTQPHEAMWASMNQDFSGVSLKVLQELLDVLRCDAVEIINKVGYSAFQSIDSGAYRKL